MSAATQDLKYAFRMLRRTPGFTAVAVASLAIGIGVNTTAFSVLNALLFRPLPGVEEQHRIVDVKIDERSDEGRFVRYATVSEFEFLHRQSKLYSGLAAAGRFVVAVRANDATVERSTEAVSPEFFAMLGTHALRGRLLDASDSRADGAPSAVVTESFWRDELGSAADAIGQVIHLGSRPFTVVGVTPRDFVGTQPGELFSRSRGAPAVYIPLSAAKSLRAAPAAVEPWLRIAGRLKPGVSRTAAEAEANVVLARFTPNRTARRQQFSAQVTSLGAAPAGEAVAGATLIMIVPLLILLVTCANLANQLLARGIVRGREIAVRLSLGASRRRLITQLLIESAVLAAAGSAGGLVLSAWLGDLLRLSALQFPLRLSTDLRVVAFAVAVSAATVLLFGLLPALRATRPDLASALRTGSPVADARPSRLRGALVVAQVATSLALLTVMSLFIRGSHHGATSGVTPASNKLFNVTLELDAINLDTTAGRALQHAALERLQAMPGIAAVGLASFGALESAPEQRVQPAGASRESWIDVGEIQGDWFGATDTRLLRGRLFAGAEMYGTPQVSVVDSIAAARFWPRESPIGKSLRIGSGRTSALTIVVGVVATRRGPLDQQPEGMVLVPGGQMPYHATTHLTMRVVGNAPLIEQHAAEAIQSLNTSLPRPQVLSLRDEIALQTAPARLVASGLGLLGGIAVTIAAMGIYSVLSFLVAQRRREIGVRVALGAERRHVIALVLHQSGRLAMVGIVLGAVAAAAVAMLVRALLYGLAPLDPVAFAGTALLFAIVMLIASAIPARQAAGIDPMHALRSE